MSLDLNLTKYNQSKYYLIEIPDAKNEIKQSALT